MNIKDHTQSSVDSTTRLFMTLTVEALSQKKLKEENNTWEAEYKHLNLSKRSYYKWLGFSKNFGIFAEGDGFPL